MKKLLLIALTTSFFLLVIQSKAQTTLLYYWSFDTATVTTASTPMVYLPVKSDSTTMGTPGTINWEFQPGQSGTLSQIDTVWSGSYINARGSALNTPFSTNWGLRPRNPSTNEQLVFNIPTTGYQNIVIKFETEASSTSSGILNQTFDYSTDGGTTFSSTGITVTSALASKAGISNEDSVDVVWGLVTVDLTGTTAVNNASNLIFRIIYTGANTSKTKGNDRFDNITVEGTALSIAGNTNSSATNAVYSLYPNPTGSNIINLSAPTTGSKTVTVYNTTGQAVYTTTVNGQQSTLTVDNLKEGVYYMNINDNGANYSLKFAKN